MNNELVAKWLAKSNKERYLNRRGELKWVRIIIEPMPDYKYIGAVQMMTYDQLNQVSHYRTVSSNALCESYEDALKYCTETVMPILNQKLESNVFSGWSVNRIHLWFKQNGFCVYNKPAD